jgi:hypothetical protein
VPLGRNALESLHKTSSVAPHRLQVRQVPAHRIHHTPVQCSVHFLGNSTWRLTHLLHILVQAAEEGSPVGAGNLPGAGTPAEVGSPAVVGGTLAVGGSPAVVAGSHRLHHAAVHKM